MKCSVVVPAAGSGSRFGGEVPKQFVPLAGRPLVVHTLARLASFDEVDEVVIAVAPDQMETMQALLRENQLGTCRVTVGGASRAESVLKGLDALSGDAGDDRVVAVHDAVRPFVTRELFVRLLAALAGADGSFPGLPPTDTLHVVDAGFVSESPSRERLSGAQTPQCFRLQVVRRALEEAARTGAPPTDEVSAVVRAGGRVAIVEGDPGNFKITRPEDLARAERVLTGRGD